MKQIILTFEKEEDYNEFTNSIINKLPAKIGDIEENDNIVHVIIKDLKGDIKPSF